jgi:hypothetical protein
MAATPRTTALISASGTRRRTHSGLRSASGIQAYEYGHSRSAAMPARRALRARVTTSPAYRPSRVRRSRGRLVRRPRSASGGLARRSGRLRPGSRSSRRPDGRIHRDRERAAPRSRQDARDGLRDRRGQATALRDLDERLRGRQDSGGYLDALRRRVRLAYVQGAEEWTRANIGRTMTPDELAGVLERYTGR